MSEKVTATFYDDEHEDWSQKTVTIRGVLDSVCDEYTILSSAQQWIPCAEKMPEYDEEVLVDYLGHVRLAARSRNNEDYPWYLITTRFSVKRDHVKAWMPMPSPYREEDTDHDR